MAEENSTTLSTEKKNTNDKSYDFREEIPQDLLFNLQQCIECGKCVGSCTAARVSNFNSRKLVQKVIDSDETVLMDEDLWKCFLCHLCWMICPKKDMNLPELIMKLREIAINRGYAPSKLGSLTHWLDKFCIDGKIAGPNKVSEKKIKEIKNVAAELDIETLRIHIENLNDISNESDHSKNSKESKEENS